MLVTNNQFRKITQNCEKYRLLFTILFIFCYRVVAGIIVSTMFLPSTITAQQAVPVAVTISPISQNVSTTVTTIISYINPSIMSPGSTIRVNYSNAFTGTITTTNTSINGIAPTSISSPAVVNSTTNFVTITLSNTVGAGTLLNIIFNGLIAPSTIGNYPFTFTASNNAYGGGLHYVGGANTVQVRTVVPFSLEFDIRNSTDTADSNTCDFGDVSLTAVSQCSYRLKISTNSPNGFSLSMITSGNMTNGSSSIANAIAGPIGSTVVAGQELYGARIDAGLINGTGGISTILGYSSAVSNIVAYNTTTNQNIINSTGPNNPSATGDSINTILVSHSLAISATTPAGIYTQTVTYQVTPTI